MKGANANGYRGSPVALRLELSDGRVLHEGKAAELTFPLQIGRKAGSVWTVPSDERSVSGVHAELFLKRHDLYVRDLGSRNGLFVMGARVSEQRLVAGVQVGIGQCRLVVDVDRMAIGHKPLPFHRLEQMNEKDVGRIFELREKKTLVGCAATEGILIASMLVSKRHAEIAVKDDDTCWVQDLGSQNGTMVDHVRLAETERVLHHGDIVSFANVEFRFLDRHAKYDDGSLLRKAIVAVVTAAVCGIAYLAVQIVFPSASRLLKTAADYEFNERFGTARAFLDRAMTARGGAELRPEIDRKRGDLDVWEGTLRTWEKVKTAFAQRRWIDGSTDLGSLLESGTDRWGWNTQSALTRKKQAILMKRFVDVFLHARSAMGGTFSDREIGHERDVLFRHAEAMSAALSDPGWDEKLPTGKLREDMEEQVVAVQAIIADLDEVRRQLQRVQKTLQQPSILKQALALTEPFSDIERKLTALAVEATKREFLRKEMATKVNRKYVSSDIVKMTCDGYTPVFHRFGETRDAFISNLVALTSLKYEKLKKELPCPSDQQCAVHAAFGEIRGVLKAANDALCGSLCSSIRDQVSRLEKWKIMSGMPSCLDTLLDEKTMAAVFSCDSLKGRRPSTFRSEAYGKYDEVLGMEAFVDYLRNMQESRVFSPQMPEGRAEPALSEVVRLFAQIGNFQKALAQPDAEFLVGYDAPNSESRLRQIAAKAVDLQEKRDLLTDMWWNCSEDEGIRARIISRGTALALDGGQRLQKEDADDLKKELDKLRDEILKLKRRIDADPECVTEVRPQILKIGIPGLHGVNGWWDQETRVNGGVK